MDRKDKILRSINRDGIGLEIGPSISPIAPKKEGFNVETIDTNDQETLKARFSELGIENVDAVEEVDYIWNGETYQELTGRVNHYDWIIASHVIEHVPDLIGFLLDCSSVLKEDGVLSLAIPDKRYCFDYYRPVSGLAKAIDTHLANNKRNSPGTVVEYILNRALKSGKDGAWSAPNKDDDKFTLEHDLDFAMDHMNRVINHDEYVDVHNWCFVPHAFRLMLKDLFDLGFIKLQEVDFMPTVGCEFFISLSLKGSPLKQSRVELLDIIEQEIKGLA